MFLRYLLGVVAIALLLAYSQTTLAEKNVALEMHRDVSEQSTASELVNTSSAVVDESDDDDSEDGEVRTCAGRSVHTTFIYFILYFKNLLSHLCLLRLQIDDISFVRRLTLFSVSTCSSQ